MIGNLLKNFAGTGGGKGIMQAMALMSDIEMETVSLEDAPQALRALALAAAKKGAHIQRVQGIVKGDRLEVLLVISPATTGTNTLVTKKTPFALDAANAPA